MRDIGDEVGITERAAHRIINELVAAGYLTKYRVGRHNSHAIHPEVPLRHPLERHLAAADLLALSVEPRPQRGRLRRGPRR